MVKSLFWIWLLLTIIGLVCNHKNVKLETFVQDIKKCFKYSPVSSTIIVVIIVIVISICNQKLFGNKETSVENKESPVVSEEQAMQNADSMAAVEDNTDIEVPSGNRKAKSGVEIAREKANKENSEGQDISQDDSFQESVDEDSEITADEPQEDFDAGRDSPIWSTDYLFWYLKEYDFSKIENLVDVAEEFWSKKDELEANNDPVSVKLNSKVFSADYYSLTSERSNYVYVGDMEDNRPSGFGVLSLLFEDEGCYRPIYCGNFKDGRFDGTGIKLQDYDVNLIYSVNNVIEMGMLPTNDVNDYVESISYIGNFSKGNQNGFGMSIKYPDLDAYLNFLPGGTSELADLYLVNSGIELNIGTNKNGELQGDDCYIYSNKYLLYEGDMKDGKMNGDGVEYYSNSDQIKYEGHFRKGKYDGKGVMYDENGKIIYDGKWKNGDYAS